MKLNNVKKGALLSYLLIFLNTAYGLIVTPFILKTVGDSQYGVYKTIASLSAALMVLDLGFGGTVLRYVAKFVAERKFAERDRYLGMSLFQTLIVAGLLLLVGSGAYFAIAPIYCKGFNPAELHLAKQLYIVLLANVAINFFENVFFGIIAGHNRFAFANGMKVLLLLAKTAAIYILLPIFQSTLVIVLAQLILTCVVMLVHILYIRKNLNVRFVFSGWDKSLFFESFRYTLLLFLQSIVIQFNGNVDNMVIGAVKGAQLVTVYSFAIMLFNMYEQLSTSISGLMLPTVTKRIQEGADGRQLEELVIRVGRLQFAMLGAAMCGFIVLGNEFFSLWLGDGFSDCYWLVLILIIPVTVPLVQNVCLSILRAKNLMGFRTLSLVYSTIINCVLTFFGTIRYGYFAAAIGTSVSTVVGSIVSMNIYYYKKLGMNPFRMLWGIVYKAAPALAIASCGAFVMKAPVYRLLPGHSLLAFIAVAAIFLLLYAAALIPFYKKEFKAFLGKA